MSLCNNKASIPKLIILDKDLNILKYIDDFESLIWTKNYYKLGEFQIILNNSYFDFVQKDRYIYKIGDNYTGRIDEIKLKDGNLTLKGYFVEELLNFRVNITRGELTDKSENIMHIITKTNCIDRNPIKFLQMGVNNNLSTSTTYAKFGASVSESMYNLGETSNLSHNLKVDISNKTITFNTFRGLDRTKNQNINNWVIISKEYDNIVNEEFENITNAPNFAYVYGAGESYNRQNVTIDYTQKSDERREIFVDARDLSFDEETMNQARYLESLIQRGKEKLTESGFEEVSLVEVDLSNENWEYSLGDIVTYTPSYIDSEQELQIVTIREIYEPNNIKKYIILNKTNISTQFAKNID